MKTKLKIDLKRIARDNRFQCCAVFLAVIGIYLLTFGGIFPLVQTIGGSILPGFTVSIILWKVTP